MESNSDLVKVWDPLVRVFHWALVLVFVVAWITAEEMDKVHEFAGYAIAALIGLRLAWGLIGPKHARLSDFIYGRADVIGNVKDTMRMKAKRYLGHSPAGGAMVLALLLTLAVIIATGVMMEDRHWLEDVHEGASVLMLWLIGLHVAGVIVTSLQHRENLIKSMFTGYKRSDGWNE